MAKQPWEPRPNESAPAYQAALAYFEMGPERSHVAVARKLRKSTGLMTRWSRFNGWVERARDWDARQAGFEARAREKEQEKRAKVWVERQDQDRDANWSIASGLRVQVARQIKLAGDSPLAATTAKTLADAALASAKLAGQALKPDYLETSKDDDGSAEGNPPHPDVVAAMARGIAEGLRVAREVDG